MNDNIRRATIIMALEELKRSIEQPTLRRLPRRQGGETGSEYIHRLLHGHPELFKEQLRLTGTMFVQLVNLMIERNLLVDGRFISVSEQVGICLYLLAKGNSYRDAADTFKHSVSTISKYFKRVLDALIIVSFDIIRPHRDFSEVPPEVANNPLYWPFFKVNIINFIYIKRHIYYC